MVKLRHKLEPNQSKKNARPLISIVTISFNQSPYLRECIESVVNQKGDNVEYIVVDPGSTDGSRDILNEFRHQIDHLVLEPDEGPADGLNKGFERATGKYGFFLNSDDFLLPNVLPSAEHCLQNSEEKAILLFSGWIVDNMSLPKRRINAWPLETKTIIRGNSVLFQQGMFFPLQLFRDVGGFSKDNKTCWDFDLLCKFMKADAEFLTFSKRISAFRIHEASISGGAGGKKLAQKFEVEKNRIISDLARSIGCNSTRRGEAVNRYIKFLRHPLFGIDYLVDKYSPRLVSLYWEKDAKMTTKIRTSRSTDKG